MVVLPKGFDHDRIPGILTKKKQWLETAQEKIDTQRKFFEPEPPGKMPERMNHSQEFWAIVRDHEPDYRALDDNLRSAWRFVPAWLDADKMRGENGGEERIASTRRVSLCSRRP